MTIDYVVKKQAIDLHLQGRGRNEICRILNGQKMRISEATITHLIQDWKRQHQDSNSESSSQLNESRQVQYQTSVSSIPQKEQQQEDKTQETITISPKTPQCTAINIGMPIIADTGSPSSNNTPHYGEGLKPDLAKSEPDSKNSGAPLSFFLNKMVSSSTAASTATADDATNIVAATATTAVTSALTNHPVANLVNLEERDSSFPAHSFTRDPEIEMQDLENSSIIEDPEIEMQDLENSSIIEDWNPDEAWPTRLWVRVMDERRQRQEELMLIEQKKKELDEQKQNITQMTYNIDERRHDLEIRENRLLELEPLIPCVKQLQNIGITFDLIIPYMETLNEKAVAENIDLKTSAYNLAHELRDYRQLGSLHKGVEQAKQQLSILDAFTAQKQQAMATLMNLQLAGFSEKEITE